MGKVYRSAITIAKVTLVFMNLWVMAVVLVVSLGHWRVFDSAAPNYSPDNSHLVVMRELNSEGELYPPFNMTRPEPVILQASEVFPKEEAENENELNLLGHNKPIETAAQASTPKPVTPAPPKPISNDRVDNLRHWCKQQHPVKVPPAKIPSSKLSSILVDEKHKFLFCQIPGVAQNEWRKILLVLNGIVNTTNPAGISGGDVYGKYGKSVKRLSEYPESKRGKMLEEYFKVVFVRDPLERLLKAHELKLASKYSTYFHKAFGTQIIKQYRKGATTKEIEAGSNVKFSEFSQYIVDSEHQGKAPLNEHWLQYYQQCHPCLVQYDFVGKFETIIEDINKVLKKINVKSTFSSPLATDIKTISEKIIKSQYGLLNGQTLNNIYKIYSIDYTLFGYKHPRFLHELMDKAQIFHDY